MYNQKQSREILDMVAEKLTANGMHAIVTSSIDQAKAKVLELLSSAKENKSEIMTMTSVTLDTIGIPQALKDGGYNLTRTQLMDPSTSAKLKRQLGVAPDVSIASVAAVTKDGHLVIASNTGSQLPAAAYGAGLAIFVIGAQKIVEDVADGMKRIYDYVLPLESVRANKAYNITTGSEVKKILIMNKEIQKGRVEVILVEEELGF